MVSKISEGVEITVETFYQEGYSNQANNEYMFAYKITIDNHNSFAIQLLTRHWTIYDSTGEHRKVDGEGVIGVQPVLNKGEHFSYVSGCSLRTDIGKMQGFYTMQNLNSNQLFKVRIPAFNLVLPAKLN
jgi:ApaG protein